MVSKLSGASTILLLSMSISNSWAGPTDNPCIPIAQECMKNGYVQGGHDSGKGLVEDCVMPVVGKTKTLPNTNFSDMMLQQCDAFLKQKMQEQSQQNMNPTPIQQMPEQPMNQ